MLCPPENARRTGIGGGHTSQCALSSVFSVGVFVSAMGISTVGRLSVIVHCDSSPLVAELVSDDEVDDVTLKVREVDLCDPKIVLSSGIGASDS